MQAAVHSAAASYLQRSQLPPLARMEDVHRACTWDTRHTTAAGTTERLPDMHAVHCAAAATWSMASCHLVRMEGFHRACTWDARRTTAAGTTEQLPDMHAGCIVHNSSSYLERGQSATLARMEDFHQPAPASCCCQAAVCSDNYLCNAERFMMLALSSLLSEVPVHPH